MSTAAEVKVRLQQRDRAVVEAMKTPEGAELLRALEAEFYDCDLMGRTPEETAFKLGQRDVVVFLRAAQNRTVPG